MSTLQAIIAAIAITFIMGILFGFHILYRRYLIKDSKEVEEQMREFKGKLKKP